MSPKITLRNGSELNKETKAAGILCITVMVLMLILNFYTMYDLLMDFLPRVYNFGSNIFAIILCFAISAIFVLLSAICGGALCIFLDVESFSKSKRSFAIRILILSGIILLATFIIFSAMRLLEIFKSGGFDAFAKGIYAADYADMIEELSNSSAKALDALLARVSTLDEKEAIVRDFLVSKVTIGEIAGSRQNNMFIKDIVFLMLPLVTSVVVFVFSYFYIGIKNRVINGYENK